MEPFNNRNFSAVQVSVNQIFTPEMLHWVREAVLINHRVIVEGHLLANLHVLRMLSIGASLPTFTSSTWQTLFERCYPAVSHATGYKCQQYDPAKDPQLTASYQLYNTFLPENHSKPENQRA